jgi:hypothetical protein
MTSVTFGKMTGPSDMKCMDIMVDGVAVGIIESSKAIHFRPAKRIEFDVVRVTLWDLETEASFGVPQYDAASALKAAKSWAKAQLAA